jgi:DNA-binding MarR family transcriptional regulator
VFVVAAAVAAVAFLLSWGLQQRPLRDSVAAGTGIGESFAMPKPTDSLAEASRALTVLVGRAGRRELVEHLAQRAGVELSPAACWLIIRLHEDPAADIPTLCADFDIPLAVGEGALDELTARSLVVTDAQADGRPGREVTAEGTEIVARLIEERRASLARLCDGWEPEQNPELAALLVSLAHELAQEAPVAVGAAV